MWALNHEQSVLGKYLVPQTSQLETRCVHTGFGPVLLCARCLAYMG